MSFDPNMILSTSGLVVALCALIYTIRNFNSQREHNKLSVKPFLVGSDNTKRTRSTRELSFEITNKGVGPALIKKFSVTKNGEHLKLEEAIKQCLGDKPYQPKEMVSLGTQSSLIAGEGVVVGHIEFPCKDEKTFEEYQYLINGIALRVEYESIYGEPFVYEIK